MKLQHILLSQMVNDIPSDMKPSSNRTVRGHDAHQSLNKPNLRTSESRCVGSNWDVSSGRRDMLPVLLSWALLEAMTDRMFIADALCTCY